MRSEKDFDQLIDQTFQVPRSTRWLTRLIHRRPRFWVRLGNLETNVFADSLADLKIDRPIFVAGLARSGSTKLLEVLAAAAGVVTHQYRDFPAIFTPIWWSRANGRRQQKQVACERAHGDGLMVSLDSPEAMEEPIWSAFFPHAHDVGHSQVLTGDVEAAEFARFYTDHLRKILFLRNGRRYTSKGNYNLTRMGYLQRLFPDARFVVPVRSPASHVASLMKQHRLFCMGETRYPHALEQMQALGHFEFGLDRRPINVGDAGAVQSILQLWNEGEEVRGWARYWNMLHCWLADQLEADSELRAATQLVRYEDFCSQPDAVLTGLFEHCRLEASEAFVASLTPGIRAPTYYNPDFSADDLETIANEAGGAAKRFDYEGVGATPRLQTD